MNRKTIFIIMMVMAVTTVRSQEVERFSRYDFSFGGSVRDLIAEDINGDGKVDLTLVVVDRSKEPPIRTLVILFYDGDKGFHKGAQLTWPFPDKVAAIDVGDVTADPGRELIFITEDGVMAASVAGMKVGPLKPLLAAESLVAIPYKRDVPYYNFVRDYTGDGKDDILVTGFHNSTLAVQGADYTFTNQTINLRPEMSIESFDFQGMLGAREDLPLFRVSYRVPVVYAKDYDGDGRLDLLVQRREEIEVFLQGPDGFSKEPSKKFKIVLFEESKDKQQKSQDYGPPMMLQFEDFDQDGKIDILANQVYGRPPNLKAKTHLYLGKNQSAEKGKPDYVFVTEQPGMGSQAQDINNDGLLDIHMGTITIGLWTASKAVLTGDVTVEMAYFFQRPDHTFPTVPDSVVGTDLRVSASKLSLESGIPNFYGDFNGDGFPDQVLGTSEKNLVITLRNGLGQHANFRYEIKVPVPTVPKVSDINNDGYSDLILHYRDQEDWVGDLHVFINRGDWPTLAEIKP